MQNGQVVRTVIDDQPRKFEVSEVLYEDDDRQDQVGQGRPYRDATRWNELVVARTSRGAIVLRAAWVTRWQGEQDRVEWRLAEDEDKAARILAQSLGGDEDALTVPHLARHALTTLGWFDAVAVQA